MYVVPFPFNENPLPVSTYPCVVVFFHSLRSGPGRRPRSIRGTRHDTDEEEGCDSEDSTSLNGDDDDDYRPIHTTRAQQQQQPPATATASASSTGSGAGGLLNRRLVNTLATED